MRPRSILKQFLFPIVLLLSTSCVQETHMKTVIFKVDLRGMDTITKVGVRGNFTTPPWEKTLLLSDVDQDGIYELRVSQKTAASQAEFKFVDQNGTFELNGQNNRVLHFEYEPETLQYSTQFNNPKGKQSKQNP